MSETKIGQIRLPESQIGQKASIGFPVRVRAYSRSENPDLILNNISNHNLKTHTGGKLNNTVKKNLGYASGYVSRERGATWLQRDERGDKRDSCDDFDDEMREIRLLFSL